MYLISLIYDMFLSVFLVKNYFILISNYTKIASLRDHIDHKYMFSVSQSEADKKVIK